MDQNNESESMLSEGQIEEDSNSSEDLMQQVFDLEACDDSDAQEAIRYLKLVRTQAQNAPKFTQCELPDFERKIVDQKYLENSSIVESIAQYKFPQNWQDQVLTYFTNARNNIQISRQWKKEVGDDQYYRQLSDYKEEDEQTLMVFLKRRDQFVKNLHKTTDSSILPTLDFLIKLQYFQGEFLLQWLVDDLQKSEDLPYQLMLWIYSVLLILEPPLDADNTALLNTILKKALQYQDKQKKLFDKLDDYSKGIIAPILGMCATIITIIRVHYKQYFRQ